MLKYPSYRSGLTMIELLVVIAILGVMMILFLMVAVTQINRSLDARRKSDLEKIKVAFENYYNDNSCYPPANILGFCNGDNLKPYLEKIPCDPLTGSPYYYLPIEGAECSGYRLFTSLSSEDDPAITKVGCSAEGGCGENLEDWNYGVSSGISVGIGVAGHAVGGATYACAPGGECNVYDNPVINGCPISFSDPSCFGSCGDLDNRCDH